MKTRHPHPCPCGRGMFAQCCGPLLEGKAWAATAEALMRSRYSAFATGTTAYLVRTHIPAQGKPPTPTQLRKSMQGVVWTQLCIEHTEHGGFGQNHGVVAFKAYFKARGVASVLEETSVFRRGEQGWVYVDGASALSSTPP